MMNGMGGVSFTIGRRVAPRTFFLFLATGGWGAGGWWPVVPAEGGSAENTRRIEKAESDRLDACRTEGSEGICRPRDFRPPPLEVAEEVLLPEGVDEAAIRSWHDEAFARGPKENRSAGEGRRWFEPGREDWSKCRYGHAPVMLD